MQLFVKLLTLRSLSVGCHCKALRAHLEIRRSIGGDDDDGDDDDDDDYGIKGLTISILLILFLCGVKGLTV